MEPSVGAGNNDDNNGDNNNQPPIKGNYDNGQANHQTINIDYGNKDVHTITKVKSTHIKYISSKKTKHAKKSNLRAKSADIGVKAANTASVKSTDNVKVSSDKNKLPQTGENKNNLATLGLTVIGANLIALAGVFKKKKIRR